jgi:hypothetical protein
MGDEWDKKVKYYKKEDSVEEAIERLEHLLKDHNGETAGIFTEDGNETIGMIAKVKDDVLVLKPFDFDYYGYTVPVLVLAPDNFIRDFFATAYIPLHQITIVGFYGSSWGYGLAETVSAVQEKLQPKQA